MSSLSDDQADEGMRRGFAGTQPSDSAASGLPIGAHGDTPGPMNGSGEPGEYVNLRNSGARVR